MGGGGGGGEVQTSQKSDSQRRHGVCELRRQVLSFKQTALKHREAIA